MKRNLWSIAVLGLVGAACSDSSDPSAPARLAPLVQGSASVASQNVPDEYIVVLRKGVNDVSGEATKARRIGAAVTAEWEHALKGFGVKLSPAALTELRRNPNIESISPNGVIHAIATQTPTPSWGLDRIDQRTNALDNSFTYPNSGAGVHAYIIDTGLNLTHNEFTGRVGNGADFAIPANGTVDCNGHGSHVAGTIGGTTYGIAKSVTLHAVRVLDCAGSGQWTWYISGINWIIANKGANVSVANASLGGGINAPADAATDNLAANGVLFAIASGNSSADACNSSPSRRGVTNGVVSTNASGNYNNGFPANPPLPVDSRASFSNFGPCTDIYAPGVAITSAWIGSNSATNRISGTSMASPHVAGVAALYRSNNTALTPAQVEAAMKADATVNAITGNPANTPNLLVYTGNIGGGGGNQPPVANFTVSCNNSTGLCSLDASSSTDDGGLGNLTFTWTAAGRPTKTGVTTTRQCKPTVGCTITETLTVTDAGGLTSTKTLTYSVVPVGSNQPPVARFTWNCNASHFCSFDGTTSTDDVGIVSWTWKISTGFVVGTGSTLTKQFASARSVALTLTVADGGGLTNSTTQTVIVP